MMHACKNLQLLLKDYNPNKYLSKQIRMKIIYTIFFKMLNPGEVEDNLKVNNKLTFSFSSMRR